MKKLILFSFTLVFAGCMGVFGQDVIPSHSFELWENGAPVGWSNPSFFSDVENVLPSDDAADGQVSAHFKIVYSQQLGDYPPAGLNSEVFAVTERHNTLDGYFKGNSEEMDFLTILVYLYKEGFIIGTGTFITMDDQPEWDAFSLDINYYQSGTPDSASINIAVGGEFGVAHEGTEFRLDDLTWDNIQGVGDWLTPASVTLSPNPATTHLQLQFVLDRTDRIALEVIGSSGKVQSVIEARDYSPGENMLKIDVTNLPAGIYFLYAKGDRYRIAEKFMITR